MYARGMTVREIRGHLEELCGIDVLPDLISVVTDAVLDEVAEWQNSLREPSVRVGTCPSLVHGNMRKHHLLSNKTEDRIVSASPMSRG